MERIPWPSSHHLWLPSVSQPRQFPWQHYCNLSVFLCLTTLVSQHVRVSVAALCKFAGYIQSGPHPLFPSCAAFFNPGGHKSRSSNPGFGQIFDFLPCSTPPHSIKLFSRGILWRNRKEGSRIAVEMLFNDWTCWNVAR